MKVQIMSARQDTPNPNQVSENSSAELAQPNHPATPLSPSIQRACTLIKKGDYTGAANLLAAAGRDPQTRNALGVCLMRAGRVDAAVDLYRSFVLVPGTLLERTDVSNAYKRNFATALLLKGLPSGALAVLKQTREPQHPVAASLYMAIKQWERSLSWWNRLDWKLNAVEPRSCHVSIDFEPGEFDFHVELPQAPKPERPVKGVAKAAV